MQPLKWTSALMTGAVMALAPVMTMAADDAVGVVRISKARSAAPAPAVTPQPVAPVLFSDAVEEFTERFEPVAAQPAAAQPAMTVQMSPAVMTSQPGLQPIAAQPAGFHRHHGAVYDESYCDDCEHGHGGYGFGSYLRCKFGFFIPSGNGGRGVPLAGKYHRVYPQDPNYFDARDGQIWAAQGYGVPVAVPLAPVVGHTYNYGWGIPSSRLTPVSHPAH